MRHWLIILVGLGVCAGCGRKFAPVSSTTATVTSKDTTTHTHTSTDTTQRYVERLVRKILHGSTAVTSTNIPELDSLVSALRAMPTGKDTVYLTDPTQAVALKAYLNKLGQLQLACQSKDREYFERHISDQRTIRYLRDSITKIKSHQTTTTNTVVEEKKTVWQGLKESLNWLLWVLVFAVAIAAIGLLDKVFEWVKNKLKRNEN